MTAELVDGVVLHVCGGEGSAQQQVRPVKRFQSRCCEDLQRYCSEAGTVFIHICDESCSRPVAIQVGRFWILGEVDLLIGNGRHSCAVALLVDDGDHRLSSNRRRDGKGSPIVDGERSDIA